MDKKKLIESMKVKVKYLGRDLERLEQTLEGEVKDESFEDTLIDLANYALLTLVLYKER